MSATREVSDQGDGKPLNPKVVGYSSIIPGEQNRVSTKKRSSNGCLTCKIRKKRCDEVKPICGDCQRLGRRCEYITNEMSEEQVRILKEEMELVEQDSKSRKRKKKVQHVCTTSENAPSRPDLKSKSKSCPLPTDPKISGAAEATNQKQKLRRGAKKKHRHSGKVVFNPLAMNMVPTAALGSLHERTAATEVPVTAISKRNSTSSMAAGLIPPSNMHPSASANSGTGLLNSTPFLLEHTNITKNSFIREDNPKEEINKETRPMVADDYTAHIQMDSIDINQQNNPRDGSHDTNNYNNQMAGLIPALSPLFLSSLSNPFNETDSLPTHPYLENTYSSSNIPSLSLNGEENITNFSDLFSNGFSKLLQNHFKTENGFDNEVINEKHTRDIPDNNGSPSLTQLQDMFKTSPHFQSLQINEIRNSTDTEKEIVDPNNYKNSIVDENKLKENAIQSHYSNSFEMVNQYNNKDTDNNRTAQRTKQTGPTDSFKTLQIYTNPSVIANSTLAHLSGIGQQLYEYYRNRLSFVASSAPKTENMYLNTFLPMAHVDKSVLYGILAWSAFHLGGPVMEKQGSYYIKLALEGFYKNPILNEEAEGKSKLLCDDVDVNDDDIVKEPVNDENVEAYENLELSGINRDNLINMRLAAFLILCGVEICKGDVSKWSKYLTYGAKLIKLKGGLETFNKSKDEHFLVTNYAYHDITAIQVINERTIHFDLNEYEKMWSKSNELGFTDPLHGISSPVFKLLAEINTMVIKVQKLIKRSQKYNKEHNKNNTLLNISESPNEKVYGLDEEDYWMNDIEGSSIASSIDELFLNGIPSTVSDEWNDAEFDKDVNLEDLHQIMSECQGIEQRISNVKPKLSPYVTNKELELQLTIFECFQVTAKIHLKQSVLRINSSSIEIQYLTNQLIKLLDVLLGSEFESCLCLPMFIAGMNCVTRNDRMGMTKRFESFIERYKWKNVLRCQIVIKYIWKLNCKGEKFVDWHAVVKTLGWDLSFA